MREYNHGTARTGVLAAPPIKKRRASGVGRRSAIRPAGLPGQLDASQGPLHTYNVAVVSPT
jgi:hypothetical protein